MEITCNLGAIIVDGYSFNTLNLSEAIEKVLNEVYYSVESNATPYMITFHDCRFKDTYMQLERPIYIDNSPIIYAFKNGVEKFRGEYPLNLTIRVEYSKFYNCTFTYDPYVYTEIYSKKSNNKLCNVSIFFEYIKLPYAEIDRYPSWDYKDTSDTNTAYKILRQNMSSHVNRYYLCKLHFDNDATTIRTINGDARSSLVYIDKIYNLVEISSYEYSDDEVFNVLPFEEVSRVMHSPFGGNYNNITEYTVGSTVEEPFVEVNSFKSLGKGIYFIQTLEEAFRYLNRVIPKEQTILNLYNGDGDLKLLSDYLYERIKDKEI